MTKTIVLIPSTEGLEGALLLEAPVGASTAEIKRQVTTAVAAASDNNGERSDEVIAALDAIRYVFIGNPNTDSIIITTPWSGSAIRRMMRVHHITIRALAKRMNITLKRVREVREIGVTGTCMCLDWTEAISGTGIFSTSN